VTYQDLQTKYGTDANIAKAIGVSRQLVGYWKRKGIPYGRQCMIQLATKGRLRAGNPQEEVAA
jgi:hypothetical protein